MSTASERFDPVTSEAPTADASSMRTALHVDLLVVVGVALVVQLAFPYRHDWPAHLLGGAGAMIVGAAVLPRAVHRLTPIAGFATILLLAWATEARVFGPFDLVDISYTLAGAVLTYEAAGRVGQLTGRARVEAAAWGTLVALTALAYRYGTSVGAT